MIDAVPGNPPFQGCHHINDQFPGNISLDLSLILLHTYLPRGTSFVATPMFVQASLILAPDTIRQSYEMNLVDPPIEET